MLSFSESFFPKFLKTKKNGVFFRAFHGSSSIVAQSFGICSTRGLYQLPKWDLPTRSRSCGAHGETLTRKTHRKMLSFSESKFHHVHRMNGYELEGPIWAVDR